MAKYKKIIKSFSVGLAALLAFAMTACRENNADSASNSETLGAQETIQENLHTITANQLHEINVTKTDKAFITNGITEYKIIVPNNVELVYAAEELAENLALATECHIKIEVNEGKYTQHKANEKWIILGDATLFNSAGMTLPTGERDLSLDGYVIKSKDNSVYIHANTATGVLYGVYEFLAHTVGYDALYSEMVIVTKNKTITIPDFDVTDRPDFKYRIGDGYGIGLNKNEQKKLRYSGMTSGTGGGYFIPVNGQYIHNSLSWLPPATYLGEHPDWYSSWGAGELCYTAHGNEVEYEAMQQECLRVAMEAIESSPDLPYISFTQQDNTNLCMCDTCTLDFEKYGTKSASIVKFMNDLADKIKVQLTNKAEAEGTSVRDVKLTFFAYQQSMAAPVRYDGDKIVPIDQEVVCRDNVCVWFAPIDANNKYSFYDQENNGNIYKDMKGWGALSEHLATWLYSANFGAFLYPHNTFSAAPETAKLAKECNVEYMMVQGTFVLKAAPGFTRLKEYLDAKSWWNVNVDAGALTDYFFEQYFKEAATPMRKFYDEMTAYLTYLQNTDDLFNSDGNLITDKKYWSAQMLNRWLDYIDEAYQAIEKYKTTDKDMYNRLHDHICLESLFPRFALLTNFSTYFSSSELKEQRVAFKDDCNKFQIERHKESATIDAIYSDWGV